MRRASLFLAASVMAATASAAKPPTWVSGQDPKYPPHTYMTGVGVGKDLDAARSNARAEISKTFKARIQQTLTDTQTETSKAVGKRRGAALGTQDSVQSTVVSTDNMLEGVQIAETWYDKKKKNHYALAVLNKAKIRTDLSSALLEKEEGMNAQLAVAKEGGGPVAEARALAKALKYMNERDELSAKRRSIEPGVPADINEASSRTQLEQSLEKALAKIQVVVDAESEEAPGLKDKVTAAVTSLGFQVTSKPEGAGPVLKVKSRLAVEPFDRGNPDWKFYNWKGTFELADGAGKILASSAPSGQEGHLQDATAEAKARDTGEEAMGRETKEQLSKYVLGE